MRRIDPKYFRLLSNLFGRRVLTALEAGHLPADVPAIVEISGFKSFVTQRTTIAKFFDNLYAALWQNYRCEYVYKNSLTREILQNYHSEPSAVLSEFRADTCIADFVVLNGTSSVYEIKTELDSFERLDRQLGAYQRVFDQIYVVAPESHLERVAARVSDATGLVGMSTNGELVRRRNAESNKANVDPSVIFKSLRLAEYTTLVTRMTGQVPDFRPSDRYAKCREIVANLSPTGVHDEVVSILKERCSDDRIVAALNRVPASLTAAYLASPFSKRQDANFLQVLRRRYFDLA